MQTVTIEKMTYGIDSLGHLEDGKVFFAPYGAVGDTVNLEIIEDKHDYVRTEIKEIVVKSPNRRVSPCPNFPECGGCHWLHMNPEFQRREKEEILNFIIKPLGVKQVYPMEPLPERSYRNKMELKVSVGENGVVVGNYKYRSHEVVSIKGCIVQCPENMAVYDKLCEMLNKPENLEFAKNIKTIVVRTLSPQQHCGFFLEEPPTEAMSAAMQSFFDECGSLSRLEAHSESSDDSNALTLVREKGMFNFMKRNWRVSLNSFFQNNLEGAEAILHTLLSIYQASPQKGKLLDLYCGCGTQTFLLEHLFDEVYAVESNASSYQDAIAFQKTRSNSKTKLICRRAESIFNTQATKGVIAAVHLNPPRVGLSSKVTRGLSGIKPKMITYLSCNPMTFRRDAKNIRQLGYKLESINSFDLFPGTFHMETLGLFVRG